MMMMQEMSLGLTLEIDPLVGGLYSGQEGVNFINILHAHFTYENALR